MWSCRGAVAGAVVGVLALVGCTPTVEPPATPSPTPSATQRPETKIEREQRVAYEAAEQAYRTEVAEMDRLLAGGGSEEATSKLRSVAGGPFLEEEVQALRSTRADNYRAVGTTRIRKIARAGYSPEEVLLKVCVDGREIKTVDKNGSTVETGLLVAGQLTARPSGSSWKIWTATFDQVAECP